MKAVAIVLLLVLGFFYLEAVSHTRAGGFDDWYCEQSGYVNKACPKRVVQPINKCESQKATQS